MNPDAHTIAEHMLEVGNGHTLYIQDWGNKNAKHPIVYLHGGPGSATKDKHRTPFDPATQRVIFFDQRGCGKSTPLGRWHHNTTQELAGDITRIADHLKVDTFILTGYSWGSTLALYYAIQEPMRVESLVIGGVFTGSQAELDWINNGAARSFFPEVWETYLTTVPENHRDDPTSWHFERMLGKDVEAAKQAAFAYSAYDGALMSLDDNFAASMYEEFDPSTSILEARYFTKRCFMPDRYIFKHARKLTMPVQIVQGRYDMVCPPRIAYELHQLLPNSSLTWVVSGHKGEHETVTAQRLIYRELTKE